jgi:hypothetical protein
LDWYVCGNPDLLVYGSSNTRYRSISLWGNRVYLNNLVYVVSEKKGGILIKITESDERFIFRIYQEVAKLSLERGMKATKYSSDGIIVKKLRLFSIKNLIEPNPLIMIVRKEKISLFDDFGMELAKEIAEKFGIEEINQQYWKGGA